MAGDVVVKVTIDDGTITAVEVIESNETEGIGTMARDQLPKAFIGLSQAPKRSMRWIA